jgi:Rrf2 family protein
MMTKTGLHAIRAMAVLAKFADKGYVGANRVAEEINAPPNYLGKLLQSLARESLVESQKGIGGGFRLARDPNRITLYDVIDPIEHLGRWTGCVLGWRECSDEHPCAVHERWKKVRADYLALLQRTTIADLVRNGEPVLLHQAG